MKMLRTQCTEESPTVGTTILRSVPTTTLPRTGTRVYMTRSKTAAIRAETAAASMRMVDLSE